MYTLYIVVESISTVWGAGRHVILVTNAKALTLVSCIIGYSPEIMKVNACKAFLTTECFYCAAILCTKLSILCLYNRIFPQRWFRVASIVLAAFISSWALAAVFVSIFQCIPVSSQWDPKISGHCVNYGSSVRATGIINIITDFILLGLPMPLVWRIKTSTTKKWQLTITFVLGGW